ncbi:MAG: F0F1 ATP synthase subunit epsilon [Bacilli bacterium]
MPLITMLNAGRIGIKKGADEEDLAIDKGYARCMGDVVSVLTEAAIEVENIDYAAAEDAKNEALKAIEQAKLNRNLDEIEIERLEAIARFSIAQLLAKGKK